MASQMDVKSKSIINLKFKKMKASKLLVVVLFLATVLSVSAQNYGREEGRRKKGRRNMTTAQKAKFETDRISKNLDVSDDVYNKIYDINLKYAVKDSVVMAEHRAEMKKARNESRAEIRQKMDKKRQEKAKEIEALLTEEQKAKYKVCRKNIRRPRNERRDMNNGMRNGMSGSFDDDAPVSESED